MDRFGELGCIIIDMRRTFSSYQIYVSSFSSRAFRSIKHDAHG